MFAPLTCLELPAYLFRLHAQPQGPEPRLTELGYEVQTATTGIEALNAVMTFNPEVLLLDMQMPHQIFWATVTSIGRVSCRLAKTQRRGGVVCQYAWRSWSKRLARGT
jgi:hypothetical protein